MKICFFKLKNHNVLFTFTVTFFLSRQKNNKLKENFRRKLNFLCILKVHVNLYMQLNYIFKQWTFLITQNARNFHINYPSFFIIVCQCFAQRSKWISGDRVYMYLLSICTISRDMFQRFIFLEALRSILNQDFNAKCKSQKIWYT